MSEVQHKVIDLVEGVAYMPKEGDAVITKDASLHDLLRFAQKCLGGPLEALELECQHFVNENKKRKK